MALVIYQEPTVEEFAPAVGALIPYSSSDLSQYSPLTSNALVPYSPLTAQPTKSHSFSGTSGALVPYSNSASNLSNIKGGQIVVHQQQQTTSTNMKGGQLVVHQKQSSNLSSKLALVTTHPGDEIVPPHPIAPKTLKKQQEILLKSTPAPIAPNRATLPYSGRLLKPYVEESYLACLLNQSLNMGLPGEVLEVTSNMGNINHIQVGTGGVDTPTLSYRLYFENKRLFVVFRGATDIQLPLREPDLVPIAGRFITSNVHKGYYKVLIPHMNNIVGQINANPRNRIVVTGFGNGGAIASVFYLALKAAGGHAATLALHTFGAPCVSAGMTSTTTDNFKNEAWHYVLEGDPVPSFLGNRDATSLDQLLGTGNVMHKQGYNPARLKHYTPFGSYFYMQGNGTLAEPRDLQDAQTMLSLDRRGFIKPQNHNVKLYLEALRCTVTGAF